MKLSSIAFYVLAFHFSTLNIIVAITMGAPDTVVFVFSQIIILCLLVRSILIEK